MQHAAKYKVSTVMNTLHMLPKLLYLLLMSSLLWIVACACACTYVSEELYSLLVVLGR